MTNNNKEQLKNELEKELYEIEKIISLNKIAISGSPFVEKDDLINLFDIANNQSKMIVENINLIIKNI